MFKTNNMKTFMFYLATILCLINSYAGTSASVDDDPVKQRLAKMSKPMRKECETVIKQLKKEGWKIYGSSDYSFDKDFSSIDDALTSYFMALDNNTVVFSPIVGVGINHSENTAARMACHRAITQYISLKETHILNYTVSQVTEQAYNLAYEYSSENTSVSISTAQRKIRNMYPEFMLSRNLEDNSFEVRVYYIVNFSK